MRSEHQQRVEEFMRLAGQELPGEPVVPDAATRELRARLILEEALETVAALGFDATGNRAGWELTPSGQEPDLVEIIDGCCDIKVVTTGTLSACGIPDRDFQQEVDENNLKKFGPGHRIRADGKLIKPPGFQGPCIPEMLEAMKQASGFRYQALKSEA